MAMPSYRGQFPEALGIYMEMVKSKTGAVSDMTLAVLHDIPNCNAGLIASDNPPSTWWPGER